MSTAPRFWTEACIDAIAEAFNSSPRFQKAAKSFSETLVLRAFDTPDGDDCQATFTFSRGRCVGHEFTSAKAPSPMRGEPFDKKRALARSTAPYALWVKLDRGEINVAQALVSPDYNIEGSKLKIMRYVGVLNAMNATVADVDKTY
jgi:putative sterol carrier protein